MKDAYRSNHGGRIARVNYRLEREEGVGTSLNVELGNDSKEVFSVLDLGAVSRVQEPKRTNKAKSTCLNVPQRLNWVSSTLVDQVHVRASLVEGVQFRMRRVLHDLTRDGLVVLVNKGNSPGISEYIKLGCSGWSSGCRKFQTLFRPFRAYSDQTVLLRLHTSRVRVGQVAERYS